MAVLEVFSVKERDSRNRQPKNITGKERKNIETHVEAFERKLNTSIKNNERARTASKIYAETKSRGRV